MLTDIWGCCGEGAAPGISGVGCCQTPVCTGRLAPACQQQCWGAPWRLGTCQAQAEPGDRAWESGEVTRSLKTRSAGGGRLGRNKRRAHEAGVPWGCLLGVCPVGRADFGEGPVWEWCPGGWRVGGGEGRGRRAAVSAARGGPAPLPEPCPCWPTTSWCRSLARSLYRKGLMIIVSRGTFSGSEENSSP